MADCSPQKRVRLAWKAKIWLVVTSVFPTFYMTTFHLGLSERLTKFMAAEYAAAFFLLADRLRDAVHICMNQLHDVQLAVTIARAYEGDDGPVLKEIIEDGILADASTHGNRWMATWAFWMLNRRDMAVRTLIVRYLAALHINSTNFFCPQSPIETLVTSDPASPASPGSTTLQAKSYLSNDPALIVLYKQLREKTLQTLKGASEIPAREEWEFVLRNARLYDRMGCDLLGLNLVREWEFLRTTPPSIKKMPTRLPTELVEEAPDPQKLLRRRSSLVVADMPVSPTFYKEKRKSAQEEKSKPTAPKGFEELDANSLLDSFGF